MHPKHPAPEATAAANLLMMDHAQRAIRTLAGAGIQAVAEKGAALLATVHHGDAGARAMNDVDLLIPPGTAPRAVAVLTSQLGLEPIADSGLEMQPRAGEPGRGVLRLDLHDRLHHGGRRAILEALAAAQFAPWGRGVLPVLDPERHLLEVVAHAILHHGELRPQQAADILDLAPFVQIDRLRPLAARAHLLPTLRLGLALAAASAATHGSRPAAAAAAARALALTESLPRVGTLSRLAMHWMRRRVTSQKPPGRAHLILSFMTRSPAEVAAHLARRALVGPQAALLAESGFNIRRTRSRIATSQAR